MRVLISASTFPLRPGDGKPRFVLELAEALSSRCRVAVLVPSAPGVPSRERWGEVDVHRFAYFLPRRSQRVAYGDGIDTNLQRSWLARLQLPAFLVAQARATGALARREGIDVVNSHWLVPQGLATALAAGRRGFGHVITLHGGDAHLLGRLPLARRLARFTVARSDALLASARPVREALDACLGRPSGAEIQPMGVALQSFSGADPLAPEEVGLAGPYLLFVGRLQTIKGASELLRALPRVRETRPSLGLLVVGYGEREADLRREAEALGVAEVVRFAGPRPAAYVARALRGCAVAVVPSVRLAGGRAEGMPTVVLEALAAGAPLVATATGGIPDVVRHGENGWLCRDRDPAALADAIGSALEDARGVERAARARATAARFDWGLVAERYLEVFRSVSPR